MEMHTRKKINQLPKSVADRIAAGEVVERPLSVVKELLENALDAGADAIAIEIRDGGKSYIRVTDNGCGIPEEELELAFKRHATSKISTDADLDSIETLGFRGEALASISAVSRVELITKTKESTVGNRFVLEGGDVVEKVPAGCPDGTTLIVRDLFYNTPARLKFMKRDSAESSLIIDFVSKMALAYPAIRIRMVNNGSILFSTSGKGEIYPNICTVYSREIGEHLLHGCSQRDDMSISFWVSPPQESKSSRKNQIFFVNGRCISSKLLENAVTEAYKERLFEGRYPAAFLFLKVRADELDVNIHPNKKEVRFADEERVKSFVAEAIRGTLNDRGAIPEIREKNLFRRPDLRQETHTNLEAEMAEGQGNTDDWETKDVSPLEKRGKEEQVDIKKILSTMRAEQNAETGRESEKSESKNREITEQTVSSQEKIPYISEEIASYSVQKPGFNPADIQITGSVFATYITGNDEDYFYLIDQHAAHERIFYEKLRARDAREKAEKQLLLTSMLIETVQAVQAREEEWLPVLLDMGFEVEPFGTKSYAVKAIPMALSAEEAKAFLDDFLDGLQDAPRGYDQRQMDKIIMASCKSAVKANDRLTVEEMRRLLQDLAKCENPFSCPHGRPTFLRLSKGEIERLFKRA